MRFCHFLNAVNCPHFPTLAIDEVWQIRPEPNGQDTPAAVADLVKTRIDAGYSPLFYLDEPPSYLDVTWGSDEAAAAEMSRMATLVEAALNVGPSVQVAIYQWFNIWNHIEPKHRSYWKARHALFGKFFADRFPRERIWLSPSLYRLSPTWMYPLTHWQTLARDTVAALAPHGRVMPFVRYRYHAGGLPDALDWQLVPGAEWRTMLATLAGLKKLDAVLLWGWENETRRDGTIGYGGGPWTPGEWWRETLPYVIGNQ